MNNRDTVAFNTIISVPDGMATVPQVMSYLKVSKPTVYRMMQRGDLPSVKFGKTRRIPWESVKNFIARRLAST